MRSLLFWSVSLLFGIPGIKPIRCVPLTVFHLDSDALAIVDTKILESKLECYAACLVDSSCTYAFFEESSNLCNYIEPDSLVGIASGSTLVLSQDSCLPLGK